MKEITDVWTLPFVGDPEGYSCYIWDSDEHMCFSYFDDNGDYTYYRILRLLNDDENIRPFNNVIKNDEEIFVSDGEIDYENPSLIVRGYGYLTGTGGLNLSCEEAKELQDRLIEYAVKKLKGEKV